MMPDQPLLVAWIRNGRLFFLVGLSSAENVGENNKLWAIAMTAGAF